MKAILILLAILTVASAETTYPSWYEGGKPEYKSEAPLPKGWPQPGPFFKVVKKTYPAYRVAYTDGSKTWMTFPRLFRHIKKQDIKMTSPVEMKISDEEKSLKMNKMGFLYRDSSITNTSDNKKVAVQDTPSETYLSYTWQGCDCDDKQLSVKAALLLHAEAMGVTLYDFRVLGYNGPSVPDEKKTWEMQAKMK